MGTLGGAGVRALNLDLGTPQTRSLLPGAKRCMLRVRQEGPGAGVVLTPALQSEGAGGSARAYVFLSTFVREKKHVTIMLATQLRLIDSVKDEDKEESGGGGGGGAYRHGSLVVVKVTDRRCGEYALEDPLDEIDAMRALDGAGGHRNLLPLLEAMMDDRYIYVVVPFVCGGDMYHRLSELGRPYPEADTRRMFVEVCHGVLFMKTHGIAHMDLSLENLMQDASGCTKIIDLGMCTRTAAPSPDSPTTPINTTPPTAHTHTHSHSPTHTRTPSWLAKQRRHHMIGPLPARGKPAYVPPEIAREEAFDPHRACVWSLGVVLYMLLTRTPLYSSPKDVGFALMAAGRTETLLDHYTSLGVVAVPPEAKELIVWMCQADPLRRPTIEQVLLHPWISANVHVAAREPTTTPTTAITTTVTTTATTTCIDSGTQSVNDAPSRHDTSGTSHCGLQNGGGSVVSGSLNVFSGDGMVMEEDAATRMEGVKDERLCVTTAMGAGDVILTSRRLPASPPLSDAYAGASLSLSSSTASTMSSSSSSSSSSSPLWPPSSSSSYQMPPHKADAYCCAHDHHHQQQQQQPQPYGSACMHDEPWPKPCSAYHRMRPPRPKRTIVAFDLNDA